MTGIDGREYAGLIPPRSGRGVIGVIGGTAAMWDDGWQTYTLQWARARPSACTATRRRTARTP